MGQCHAVASCFADFWQPSCFATPVCLLCNYTINTVFYGDDVLEERITKVENLNNLHCSVTEAVNVSFNYFSIGHPALPEVQSRPKA